MKVRASSKATSTAVEYFLYSIVIIQTAIAAFAYKNLSQAELLQSRSMAYLAAIYAGVFAWVFYQLNKLHGKRKAGGVSAAPAQTIETGDAVRMEAAARELADEAAIAAPVSGPLIFGITRAKLLIVLLVFLAALKIFSWALANVLKP
jgi:hypothetical protein